MRSVDGVTITDMYHIKVAGRDGFYGVADHQSYVQEELTGTYKSNLCLLTGVIEIIGMDPFDITC